MLVEQMIELPGDGVVTRAVFEALPAPSGRWAWQLRAGRLGLTHVPVTGWQWLTVVEALGHWRRRGHVTAGDQYVADGAFTSGGACGTCLVAGGVVFTLGYDPDGDASMHDAANVHVVVEAVPKAADEREADERPVAYARMGVARYWIIRKEVPEVREDGIVSMWELAGGEYRLTSECLVSEL